MMITNREKAIATYNAILARKKKRKINLNEETGDSMKRNCKNGKNRLGQV